MKTAIAIIIFCFSFLLSSFSQGTLDTVWTITRGGNLNDEAWAIASDDSNYLYWATQQQQNGIQEQIIIYKLDENGNQIWESKHYGITWWNRAFNIKERGDYIYAAGTGAINGVLNGPIDAIIICYRKSDGDTVWIRHYNQGFGYEEIDGMELMDDAIYLTGWTKSAGGLAQQDILVLKMDYNGNFLDTAIWGSPGFVEANGEMVIDDSTIYITGRWNSTGATSLFDGDGLMASFNRSDLSFKDSAIYDAGNFMDDALGLGTDGNYLYAVGYSTNFGNSQQMTIWKYDKQLNLIWDTAWGGAGNEFARGIIKMSNGHLLISGNISDAPADPTHIMLMEMDLNGTILWYKTIGTDSADACHNLIEKNGFIYITGNSKGLNHPNNDAWLLKVGNLFSNIEEQENSNLKLQIFPNPVGEEFNIGNLQLTLNTDNRICIYDETGREIYSSTVSSPVLKINSYSWSSGIYFLKDSNRVYKLIKM